MCSGGSRPSDKMGGPSHPDSEITGGGGLKIKIFRPFRPHFGLKIRRAPGPLGSSPGSDTDVC